jgi:hypothetical protein
MATNAEAIHNHILNTVSIDDSTHYHRFNVPTGLGDMKLDEWKISKDTEGQPVNLTLRKIETETEKYLRSSGVMDEIRECARQLVELRNTAIQQTFPTT